MVLLSLHSVYLERLLSGEKLFEFRKRIPAEIGRGGEIAIYCTKPTCSVVAYAKVDGVIEDSPERLWARTRFAAGIEKEAFDAYFNGRTKGYAIVIRKVYRLRFPISMEELRGKDFAPQSFIYLSDGESARVKETVRHSRDKGVSVFVGGVHGVGKTTFCNSILANLGFKCVSASTLIGRRVEMTQGLKRVRNVALNQRVLVAESKKEAAKTLLYGLDGHYCLLGSRGQVTQLPVDVFKSLDIDLFLLLDSTVEAVQSQLQQRDGRKWTKKSVSQLMRAERIHAKNVADTLGLKLVSVNVGTMDENTIVEALVELIGKRRTSRRYYDPVLR